MTSTRTILLAVPDPQTSIDIVEALGAEWEITSTTSEAEALARLENSSFDALLADFNLGSPDASELLNQAMEKCPLTIRFLLANEADLALVAAKVLVPHGLLPKPIEPASLKSRIESGMVPQVSNSSPNGSLPAGAGASPTAPSVYAEVLKALEAPSVTSEEVGRIVARDAALMAEILRLTNSSCAGARRNITDPVEAVEFLGLETMKALMMALRYLAEHGQLKPSYLSLEQLWQHNINVASLARDLVLFERMDRRLAQEAFMAGLVHDLGKVVLVLNYDDLYGRVHSLARKQPVALWDIEKEMFGANHGEIGGCLVGMWNLPASVVEAVAFHHEPPLGENQQLTPLAAVHIANVLEHELGTADDFRVAPIIHTPFVNELGLLHRLPVWHAAFANRRAADAELESDVAKSKESASPMLSSTPPPRTVELVPGPADASRTATPACRGRRGGMPAVRAAVHRQRHWIYTGVATGVLALLALWQGIRPELSEPVPVYARSSDFQPPVVAASTPARGTPTTTAPEAAPAEPASEETSTALSVPQPEVSVPVPAPAPAAVSPAVPTNIPHPGIALKETPKPQFRLSAIFYTPSRPCAILNGATVYAGDSVDDATVISIVRDTVTVEIDGKRKTYSLR